MLTTTELILIIGMVAVTFSVRYVPLLIVGRVELPRRLFAALRFVPVAVLTAIIVPAALMPQGEIDITLNNAYVYAGIAAVFIAWRFKNLLATIGGGMIVFLLWRLLIPLLLTPPTPQ